MKYLDYKEKRQQGTFDFPIAFYHIDPKHPRYNMTYHWHPEYEIIRILEGTFRLTIDGTSITGKKDDIFFIQDGIFHGGIPQNCVYECIVFDMKLLLKDNHICTKQIQSIMRHEITIYTRLPQDYSVLRHIVDDLFRALSGKKTGYEFITQGALYQLLGVIIEKELFTKNETSVSSNQVLHFKSVLNYIEENYTEPITLEDLARTAGMNPKYFCRFFKEMTQRTPIDYINYYRIECACEQFSTKKASIIEVALSCGFNDLSYFSKTFKKYKGISPRQYINISYS